MVTDYSERNQEDCILPPSVVEALQSHDNPEEFYEATRLSNLIMITSSIMKELGCSILPEIGDFMNPQWLRWKDFIVTFANFKQFRDAYYTYTETFRTQVEAVEAVRDKMQMNASQQQKQLNTLKNSFPARMRELEHELYSLIEGNSNLEIEISQA